MYVNKWYTFTACAYLQLASGICYSFSIYSPAIKAVFGFDQTRLEGLGIALLSGGMPHVNYHSHAVPSHDPSKKWLVNLSIRIQWVGYSTCCCWWTSRSALRPDKSCLTIIHGTFRVPPHDVQSAWMSQLYLHHTMSSCS